MSLTFKIPDDAEVFLELEFEILLDCREHETASPACQTA